jgi:uncharacterized protein (DUF486 family)
MLNSPGRTLYLLGLFFFEPFPNTSIEKDFRILDSFIAKSGCMLTTIFLLFVSNIFMTYAWYGHLRHQEMPLTKAILISWGIAFFEYSLMIPANRIGYKTMNAFELKTIQEAITLVVFTGFAVFVLKEKLTWNYLVGFAFIFLAVFFIFKKW